MSLDTIVSSSLKLVGPGQLSELAKILGATGKSLATEKPQNIQNAIGMLDFRIHSLGSLHLLVGLVKAAPQKDLVTLQLLCRFFLTCNRRQISYETAKVEDLATQLAARANHLGKSVAVLPALSVALQMLMSRDATLTKLHLDFVSVCVQNKSYDAVLPVISDPVLKVERGKIRTIDILRYHYLAGLAFCAMKKYRDAQKVLLKCVTLPAEALSEIAVAAYSRLILVNLLLGSSTNLPDYTSHVVKRNIEDCVLPYTQLADALECELSETAPTSKQPQTLDEVYFHNHQIYQQDGTHGLVKQVMAELRCRHIKRLMQTFVTISLSDLKHSIKANSTQEAEKCIRDMVESGEIFAKINQKSGMVEFLEDPELYKSDGMVRQLESQVRQFLELSSRLSAVDTSIRLSDAYVQKTMELEKRTNPSAAGSSSYEVDSGFSGRDGMDVEFSSYR